VVLRLFGDRVKVFVVSVPLFPSLGRNQPLSGIKHLPAACSNLSCYETYCCDDRAIPRTFLAAVPITSRARISSRRDRGDVGPKHTSPLRQARRVSRTGVSFRLVREDACKKNVSPYVQARVQQQTVHQ
jgi:hypothetical protein